MVELSTGTVVLYERPAVTRFLPVTAGPDAATRLTSVPCPRVNGTVDGVHWDANEGKPYL